MTGKLGQRQHFIGMISREQQIIRILEPKALHGRPGIGRLLEHLARNQATIWPQGRQQFHLLSLQIRWALNVLKVTSNKSLLCLLQKGTIHLRNAIRKG